MPEPVPSTDSETFSITIGGKRYTDDELTFKEQRELRTLVRQLVEDDKASLAEQDMMDVLPALVYVIVKRDNPDFTMDEALSMKIGDVLQPDTPPDPPTKPAASKRAKS